MKDKISKTNWKTTDNRFVCFLDILGFKDLVMRKSHDEIYNSLNEISKTKRLVEESVKDIESIGDAEVYIVSFSDSIVVFSKNDNLDNFYYFLLAVRWLFTSAFNKNIPMKGGFSHGEVSLNKSEQIYFGQPIIDAYLMEEDVNYMGIAAHSTIDYYVSKLQKLELKKIDPLLFESKTPLKCGQLVHTNINWFPIIKKDDIYDPNNVRAKINSFKNSASGNARKYIDNTLDIFERTQNK